jgi:hypothetical protein
MGFDHFVNERRPYRCLRDQVVWSTRSPRNRVAWRSIPGYEGLLILRMWQGGRPVVSTANGCSHGGRGDRMEGDPELMCMWVIDLERPPPWYFSIG